MASLQEKLERERRQKFEDILRKVAKGKTLEPALSAMSLDDADMEALAGALERNPEVTHLYLNHNRFTDVGAKTLARALENAPNLRELYLYQTDITDEGATALVEALKDNRDLTVLLFDNQKTGARVKHALDSTMLNAGMFNLIQVSPSSPRLNAFTNRNRDHAQALFDALDATGGDYSRLKTSDIAGITQRRFALECLCRTNGRQDWLNAALWPINRFIDSLPQVDPASITSPDALFAPDARGFTPLDNPKTAQDFPAICQRLAAVGNPLTLEHLAGKNRDGETYLAACGEIMPSETLVLALNASGIALRSRELLDGDKPSTLLGKMIEKQDVAGVFVPENWKGASMGEIKAVIRAVPETLRPSNQHALLAAMRKQQEGGISR